LDLQSRILRTRSHSCHPTQSITTLQIICYTTPHHNRFTALFRDHPAEPVPEENFWTLWCKGRFIEAYTLTIRLGATPSGLTSAHLHHPRRTTGAQQPCKNTEQYQQLHMHRFSRPGDKKCDAQQQISNTLFLHLLVKITKLH